MVPAFPAQPVKPDRLPLLRQSDDPPAQQIADVEFDIALPVQLILESRRGVEGIGPVLPQHESGGLLRPRGWRLHARGHAVGQEKGIGYAPLVEPGVREVVLVIDVAIASVGASRVMDDRITIRRETRQHHQVACIEGSADGHADAAAPRQHLPRLAPAAVAGDRTFDPVLGGVLHHSRPDPEDTIIGIARIPGELEGIDRNVVAKQNHRHRCRRADAPPDLGIDAVLGEKAGLNKDRFWLVPEDGPIIQPCGGAAVAGEPGEQGDRGRGHRRRVALEFDGELPFAGVIVQSCDVDVDLPARKGGLFAGPEVGLPETGVEPGRPATEIGKADQHPEAPTITRCGTVPRGQSLVEGPGRLPGFEDEKTSRRPFLQPEAPAVGREDHLVETLSVREERISGFDDEMLIGIAVLCHHHDRAPDEQEEQHSPVYHFNHQP